MQDRGQRVLAGFSYDAVEFGAMLVPVSGFCTVKVRPGRLFVVY